MPHKKTQMTSANTILWLQICPAAVLVCSHIPSGPRWWRQVWLLGDLWCSCSLYNYALRRTHPERCVREHQWAARRGMGRGVCFSASSVCWQHLWKAAGCMAGCFTSRVQADGGCMNPWRFQGCFAPWQQSEALLLMQLPTWDVEAGWYGGCKRCLHLLEGGCSTISLLLCKATRIYVQGLNSCILKWERSDNHMK